MWHATGRSLSQRVSEDPNTSKSGNDGQPSNVCKPAERVVSTNRLLNLFLQVLTFCAMLYSERPVHTTDWQYIMPHMRKIISPARYNYSRTSIIRTAIIRNVDYPNGNHTKRRLSERQSYETSIIRTAIIRNVDYPNGNHTKRQLSERQSYETSNNHTHIFFLKIFNAFL